MGVRGLMTLGEFLFRQLRTGEIEREPTYNLWECLPQRRREEYEAAALLVIEEAKRRAVK
jgi:hypothetical protein